MPIYLTLDIYMSFVEASMASFTVEDCQKRVQNRFLLVQMVIKRVRQFRDGYEPLIKTDNKEIVTALREIAEFFAEQVDAADVRRVRVNTDAQGDVFQRVELQIRDGDA